ncbi:sporulation integral membrane protein YtvI [Cohnella lubricantis]|uniref:Sporulation integral membrane protein YtvI n=1 Tax=Cohnella lubricantis TaxID=2163172 RepID=A0A841T6U4_9BACL|nr:sporulation integral membrane protein YtvI [Cohnella lubricantis]MBB6675839.1 sporulation integral membrane protein YtvI [Cohnella lubricantis]MBP2119747.1 sporulation integral membrane protein YtvI [Cohnella lubricantis]
MFELYRKYWRTAFDIGIIALTVWLVMFVVSYLYHLATPVFLSFLIFVCIEPLAKWLNRLGLRKPIASGISILVFVLVLLAVLAGLGVIFYMQIDQLSKKLPEYQQSLTHQVTSITEELRKHSDKLPADWTEKLSTAIDKVTQFGTELATDFLKWLISFITSFSSFILNFSIALILAYFLSVEIDAWRKWANDRSPKTVRGTFDFLRSNVFKGIGAYFKAQAKLVSVTFAVIFVALLLLGVNNAFAIALLAGVFDVLPLLGVSTLFIPWIVYLFIVGDMGFGLWLTGLWLLVTLTRQFLEPRITGQTVGVSAFTMLAFMMVSLSLFGVIGLILAPILMILLKALYDQGYLLRWIRLPKEEFTISPLAPQQAEAGTFLNSLEQIGPDPQDVRDPNRPTED